MNDESILYYAGIGSRKTPTVVRNYMTRAAAALAELGFVLRSGACDGADVAVEQGCDRVNGKKEIYLPFKGFNKHTSELHPPSVEAVQLVKDTHPNWAALNTQDRLLLGRTSHIVLGPELKSKAAFVMCYTKGGLGQGGTGQGIRVAHSFKVPVFDLGNGITARKALERFVLNLMEQRDRDVSAAVTPAVASAPS